MIRKFLVLAAIAALSFAVPAVAVEHPPDIPIVSEKLDLSTAHADVSYRYCMVKPAEMKVVFSGGGLAVKRLMASAIKKPLRFLPATPAVYHLRC